MRLIGMLGGLGWEATSSYYRMLNEFTQKELGGQHAARILLHSVDNGAVKQGLSNGDFEQVVSVLSDAGRSLKAGGADFIIIASNVMHQFAEQVEHAAGIELFHICDPTGAEIRQAGHKTVALLGTRSTMECEPYIERLQSESQAGVITPEAKDRVEINRVIYEELSRGILRSGARDFITEVIHELHARGAEAVVLGCSELTAIVPPDRGTIRIYDTTRLHAKAAVKHALEVTYARPNEPRIPNSLPGKHPH
ncbi:aspartate/glutamate racemase family protein [Hoeflea sp.]|uniref:aspartate/glutamate racemase family protein n=1 Tax=Hoeflea sp. TaxID=1940281 RepID=UPI003A91BD23